MSPATSKSKLSAKTIHATVRLTKLTFQKQFKKRAPTALRKLKDYVAKTMKTEDVRVDPKLNKFIWSKGIRTLPRRVRVSMERKVDGQGEAPYTVVRHVPVADFHSLKTERVTE